MSRYLGKNPRPIVPKKDISGAVRTDNDLGTGLDKEYSYVSQVDQCNEYLDTKTGKKYYLIVQLNPSTTYFRQARTFTRRTLGRNSLLYWANVRDGKLPPLNTLSYRKMSQVPFAGGWVTTGYKFGSAQTSKTTRSGNFPAPSDYSQWPRKFGDGIFAFTQAEVDATLRRAQAKVHAAIKNQSVNLAQAYAERKQTVDLIASTAKRLVSAYIHVKHGRLAQAAKEFGVVPPKRAIRRANQQMGSPNFHTEKEISRRWLEVQYGWRPLLSDVFGSIDHLATKGPVVGPIQVKGSSTVSKDLTNRVKLGGNRYMTEGGNATCTKKYTVRFTVPNPALRSASQLGLTNPLLIAWELMPWSFVIDWFLPIGNWISNMDSLTGVSFESGCLTEVYKIQGERRYTEVGIDSYQSSVDLSMVEYYQELKIDRSILVGFPSIGYPSFKSPVSFAHAANALALLQLQRK